MPSARTPFLSAALEWLGDGSPDGRCIRCGFDWSIRPREALEIIAASPTTIEAILTGRDAMAEASDGGWNANAYLWHLTDMTRGWSERWVQLRHSPGSLLIGWDLDLLAIARNYTSLPTAPARWALGTSTATFVDLSATLPVETEFLHGDWGLGFVGDVLEWLAHEHVHHQLDIDERAGNPPTE